jgi:hypothetical protein
MDDTRNVLNLLSVFRNPSDAVAVMNSFKAWEEYPDLIDYQTFHKRKSMVINLVKQTPLKLTPSLPD